MPEIKNNEIATRFVPIAKLHACERQVIKKNKNGPANGKAAQDWSRRGSNVRRMDT